MMIKVRKAGIDSVGASQATVAKTADHQRLDERERRRNHRVERRAVRGQREALLEDANHKEVLPQRLCVLCDFIQPEASLTVCS